MHAHKNFAVEPRILPNALLSLPVHIVSACVHMHERTQEWVKSDSFNDHFTQHKYFLCLSHAADNIYLGYYFYLSSVYPL